MDSGLNLRPNLGVAQPGYGRPEPLPARDAVATVLAPSQSVSQAADAAAARNDKNAARTPAEPSVSHDVVIDLRGLQDISVDTSAGTVTVGAGVSLYDVYQELANEGYAFPAGSCPTVGIAGHVMGGGYGLLARSHGLTCDVLRQVTMIDYEGSTLQATANSEPDLFWACRGGGGGSFGIATQFTLNIFSLTLASFQRLPHFALQYSQAY